MKLFTQPSHILLAKTASNLSLQQSHLRPVAYRAAFRTLDRIRGFRRREDSPSSTPNPGEPPRDRSPRWFLRMQRHTSSSKRSRSSTPQPDPTSEVARDTVLESDASRDQGSEEPLKMPAFLQQTQAEIQAKFNELIWMERNRIAQGILDSSPNHQWATVQGPQTKLLDRYQNVRPWKNNRVRLRVPEGQNDYINASPILLKSAKTGKESKYIAMQGPKEGSANHVWRMIWHELASPAVIVMLTETHESGQEKCFPYFPTDTEAPPMVINEDDEFGDGFKATVRCVGIEPHSEDSATEVRKLVMKVEGEDQEKIIWHLLYTRWPDFGVLAIDDLKGFFELMTLSKQKNSGDENPRVIHCSAGVGRSGTFIALEYLMAELEAGTFELGIGQNAAEHDPVFDTVNSLREQRRTMVQAESQYAFIYTVLRQQCEQKYPATVSSSDATSKNSEPTAKVAKLGGMEDVFS